jgi:prolyl-tRNA editing enzyme YbaK/EbsC (Cys-tRNA(Pro) deacylase)
MLTVTQIFTQEMCNAGARRRWIRSSFKPKTAEMAERSNAVIVTSCIIGSISSGGGGRKRLGCEQR